MSLTVLAPSPAVPARAFGRPGTLRRRLAAGVVLGAFAATLWFPEAASAASGDIGYEGPSTVNAGASPTGSKPQSKLWWNDGSWWAVLYDVASTDFHIFKLNTSTQTWADTGVAADDRQTSRADVLWDQASGKLYVASHKFTETPGSGAPSRVYRYSYNTATNTYTRDAGFPVTINNFQLETLVIAKDSTGQLWATWVQGGNVWVSSSVCAPTCNDASWGTPFIISPVSVNADDISSVIAFGGGRLGVFWSNQNNERDYFAIHEDADPDTTWAVETALQGSMMADDHINLKTDASGRIYAAVKTSRTAATDPLTMLLVRSTAGAWSSYVFGTVRDNHTRPIIEIDEEHDVIHMFATSSGSGGTILEKTSPLSAISFPPGPGTVVIKDASGLLNNATSTKQNVNSTTGLVVAAHSDARTYFHMFESLGGSTGPTPPTAAFSVQPSSGDAPLAVQFTDTSAGTVDSWAWDFQNDGVVDATTQNAAFTYDSPGTFTAKLTVRNSAGASSATHTITVTAPSGGSTLTFGPSDDAYARSAYPTQTSGTATTLRVYLTSTSDTQSYLRFKVAGVTGSVTSAKLRLFVTDASPSSGSLYAVPETAWTESNLTWNTRPSVGSLLSGPKAAALSGWVEFDVTSYVTGDGSFSFALKDGTSNTAWYSSKEGANHPELVVAVAP